MNCDCGFVAPEGCMCGFLDSDTIVWSKVAGQESQRQPLPRVDPRSDNIASCGVSGLLAKLPPRFLGRPEVRVYRSTTQSIPDDSLTNITWDTQQVDSDSMWGSGSDIDINTAGYYLFFTSVRWSVDTDGLRYAELTLNNDAGLAADLFYAVTASEMTNHVSVIWPLNVGDEIRTRVLQTSGGALNTRPANGTTENSFCTIGAVFLGDL